MPVNLINRRWLAGLVLLYVGLRSFYWDYVPLWDGRQYYQLLTGTFHGAFELPKLFPAGHPAMLFFLFAGIPEIFFPGNVYCFNIFLTLFSAAGIVAFHGILKTFADERTTEAELLAFTALYAFHPTILGGSVNFTLDLGMINFFLLYYWAYRCGRMRLASVFATFMIFSKEPGLLLYPLPVAVEFLFVENKKRKQWLMDRRELIVIPSCIVLMFYVVMTRILRIGILRTAEKGAWRGGLGFFNPFDIDGEVMGYLADIFVLNFNWVLSLVIAAGVAFGRRGKSWLFTLTLFLASAYWFTRYRTFNNPRYILAVLPPMILCAFELVGKARLIVALALLLLFVPSDFRTLDPVSKAVFGTFKFGDHELLRIASLQNPARNGRDELFYNLEVTKYHYLQNLVYRDIKPTPRTYILSEQHTTFWPWGLHYLSGPVDKQGFHRILRPEDGILPRNQFNPQEFEKLPELTDEVFYVLYPPVELGATGEDDLYTLSHFYTSSSWKVYDLDGYKLTLFHFATPY